MPIHSLNQRNTLPIMDLSFSVTSRRIENTEPCSASPIILNTGHTACVYERDLSLTTDIDQVAIAEIETLLSSGRFCIDRDIIAQEMLATIIEWPSIEVLND